MAIVTVSDEVGVDGVNVLPAMFIHQLQQQPNVFFGPHNAGVDGVCGLGLLGLLGLLLLGWIVTLRWDTAGVM